MLYKGSAAMTGRHKENVKRASKQSPSILQQHACTPSNQYQSINILIISGCHRRTTAATVGCFWFQHDGQSASECMSWSPDRNNAPSSNPPEQPVHRLPMTSSVVMTSDLEWHQQSRPLSCSRCSAKQAENYRGLQFWTLQFRIN